MLSNNLELPPLNGFAARSTWLMLITTALGVTSALGIDLAGMLAEIGVGSTPEEIIASGERAVAAWQLLAPVLTGTWMYFERRAPKYRLVWPWS